MKKGIFILIALLFVTAGCSSQEQPSAEQGQQIDLTYEIGSDNWDAVTTVTDSPQILEAYQFAVAHPDVLDYVPCYCGCYEEAGHESNTNCFVEEVHGETVKLDTMGFG